MKGVGAIKGRKRQKGAGGKEMGKEIEPGAFQQPKR